MKHALATLAVLATFALVAFASPASAEPLRVGHDYWIGYNGVFIADEMGFFEDEGVEVDFTSFSGPGDSLPPLIAGHLDLNPTTLHNLALIAGKQGGPGLPQPDA